jgi:hypothetical protein
MESVYHIVTIRVNETSWAHVWRLHSCYFRMGYDTELVDKSNIIQGEVVIYIDDAGTKLFTSLVIRKSHILLV